MKLLVISHAGVKRINRSVYALLKDDVADLKVVVPSKLYLRSNAIVFPDPPTAGEAEIIPMHLQGSNPRKYYYPELPSFLAAYRPHIILLENDPASNLGVRLANWSKKNGAKIICQTYDNTPRGMDATRRQQGLKAVPKNLLIHLLNYYMASKVDALLVVNKDSEEIFSRYGYRNIIRIPLGYDKSVFFVRPGERQVYRSKLGLDEETVLIAYFGRLVRQKGVHLLIAALSGLKTLNWKLLLDHNHDSEDQYGLYIRGLINDLDVAGRVIYFDADHYEIAGYMRASDITVAPSITTPSFKEQYGRAVQEAMACGSITVVSDSGHLKDLVGKPALVFKEGNVDQLKDILSDLIVNNSKRQRLRLDLSKKAEGHLGIDSHVKKLKVVIQKVSGDKGL